MLQTLVAYALVAVAAGWVAWSILLPRKLKQRLRLRFKRHAHWKA